MTFAGKLAEYFITKTSTGFTVSNNVTGTVVIPASVLRIRFADYCVAFDIDGTAGQAYRLYQAAFDRAPDAVGLGTWIDWLDKGNPLKNAAAFFQTTPEFVTKYGSNVATSGFVTLLYKNVLRRTADSGGMATWSNVLNTNQWSRADVLIGFSESTENKVQVLPAIQNGIPFIPVGAQTSGFLELDTTDERVYISPFSK